MKWRAGWWRVPEGSGGRKIEKWNGRVAKGSQVIGGVVGG